MSGARWWYAIAAACAVLGLAGALALGLSVVATADESRVGPLPRDGTISLGERRLTVYVQGAALGSGPVRCRARSSTRPVARFDSPTTRLRLGDWHRVARSPKDARAGTYRLSCSVDGSRLPAGVLGVGTSPQTARILLRTVAAAVVGVGGVMVGLVLATLTLVRQRRGERGSELRPWSPGG